MILDLEAQIKAERKKRKAEYLKKWRKENPEKAKKIQRKAMLKYRLKNAKRFNQNQNNYYYRHREEILQKLKEKRKKEKEKKNNNE